MVHGLLIALQAACVLGWGLAKHLAAVGGAGLCAAVQACSWHGPCCVGSWGFGIDASIAR